MNFKRLTTDAKLDYLYKQFLILLSLIKGLTGGTSGTGDGVSEQNFVATSNQTNFFISGTPSSLIMVFTGRNLALASVDYTYSGGSLIFNTGLIIGTQVKVIY